MYQIPTPLRIEYNTDAYFDPDEEYLQDRYIVGVVDAEGKTVLYTDSGYFKISEERAQYLVQAVNSYQAMKEALEAIVARIDGVYDNPSLIKQGLLSERMSIDVLCYAKKALTLANGGQS